MLRSRSIGFSLAQPVRFLKQEKATSPSRLPDNTAEAGRQLLSLSAPNGQSGTPESETNKMSSRFP